VTQVAAFRERIAAADCGHHRAREDRPDPRHAHQAFTADIPACNNLDLIPVSATQQLGAATRAAGHFRTRYRRRTLARPAKALLLQELPEYVLDVPMLQRLALGQLAVEDGPQDKPLDRDVGQLQPVNVHTIAPARSHPGLPASGGTASSRRVDTIGEIAKPSLASAVVYRGRRDREIGELCISQREHAPHASMGAFRSDGQ